MLNVHITETSLTWTHQITLHGLSFASHNKSSMFALYKSTESQDMNHQSVLENHTTGTQKMVRMNDKTGTPNQSSSELLDGDGFAGDLVSILLPQLLHAGNEAHLVGLVALEAHAGHLHPHHYFGLHAFNPRKLASGQSRLDARSIPYNGGILEAHLARLGQVHH